jgi:hypothetical protein
MSLDALVPEIEALREQGAVIMLKWDGERTSNRCTVVVSWPAGNDFWRKDGDDIVGMLREALACRPS